MAGAVGGILMALGLFYLLALLVAPPDDARTPVEQPMSISRVQAPAVQQASAPDAAAPRAPTPPAQAPPPPPPAPVPAPESDSSLTLPEPDAPTPPKPEVSQVPLPDLEEVEPEPEPEPQPKPEPQPEPATASSSTELASSGTSGEADTQTDTAASGKARQQSADAVGSPQPTRRVPPEYPSRAQRRGIEGFVEVRFTIMPNGQVDADSIRVTKAEPRHVFERAALRAIADWQFPRGNAPREARQRLEFRLKR
ncbi:MULTISPECIES: energy transducer TonB [Chromohalobacter]|nr:MULTISPECIES: energy transducer TonB [Chromohalobacter]MCI0510355.1 TonB family protein [Chromohalobacter sp.]MCI0594760.1 TonB family protein [Chromohalobacter sp.]